ncbi:hypothetical protein NONI108955_41940 [Nocardia ninae]|uniref:Uncharacterized protein n=1 Tax=Nocardia ninae NBRC 108245 TaxID=1210091 RepID=A0A511MT24_9NOCA|nr:hypothetical protein [Nocardia ninae]GEM43729.1 hypothetical protein NN4_82480 [Nocardia ninae NBRC 108245]
MIGAVAKTDAAVARAGGQVFRALPGPVQLALLVFGLLFAMSACSIAWLDYQSYTPSPNVCRHDQAARAAELGCVPPQTVPTPAGWQR